MSLAVPNEVIIIFLLKSISLSKMFAWRKSYQTFSSVNADEGSDFKDFSGILMLCPELHKFPFMCLHSAIRKMGQYHWRGFFSYLNLELKCSGGIRYLVS